MDIKTTFECYYTKVVVSVPFWRHGRWNYVKITSYVDADIILHLYSLFIHETREIWSPIVFDMGNIEIFERNHRVNYFKYPINYLLCWKLNYIIKNLGKNENCLKFLSIFKIFLLVINIYGNFYQNGPITSRGCSSDVRNIIWIFYCFSLRRINKVHKFVTFIFWTWMLFEPLNLCFQ